MEFLRYPQVIPALFSGRLVRSSMKLYLHFNLPMDRSPGFGSTSCNFIALFRLALASAPNLKFLTSQHNVTRRSVLQKVRDRTLTCTFTACKHRVSGSLSLPSRGSFHLSLTVLCAIGHHIVFRLGWWSTLLPAGFLVPCGTLVSAGCLTFSRTGLLPSLAGLSIPLLLKSRNAVR